MLHNFLLGQGKAPVHPYVHMFVLTQLGTVGTLLILVSRFLFILEIFLS